MRALGASVQPYHWSVDDRALKDGDQYHEMNKASCSFTKEGAAAVSN